MVNSLRKGQAAERAVMHLFADTFGGHWERRPLGIPGPDLFAPAWFPYSIEIKNDARVKVVHLFGKDKPTRVLQDFWAQACEEATMMNKKPMLVVKSERRWYITLDCVTWQKLKEWLADPKEEIHA